VTHYDRTPNEETSVPMITCTRCGCESTLPNLFLKSWIKRYCPACAVKIEIRNTKILFGFLGALILFDMLRNGMDYGFTSWEAWSTISIILISTLSLIGHELSHALSARLLGGCVFGLHFGIGRQIMRRWIKKLYLGISLFPVSGLCYAGFPTTKWLRLRYLIYVSAGLLFHLSIIFITFILIGITGNQYPFLVPTFLLNGLMFIFNALPRTVTTVAGKTGSDGKRIWELITGKLSLKELQQTYYRLGASFAYQQEQIGEASQFIREGLALFPGDDFLENLRVFFLLKEGDKLEEAYTAWKTVVESKAIDAAHVLQQAVYYNNYAWTTLMHFPTSDSLQIAHRYAEKAYAMAPWVPFIKGTLAAVYVEQGQYEKGTQWALSVAKEVEEDTSPGRDEHIAANLATAALGSFRMGDQETAVCYLRQALTLAPDELTVKKVVAEMQINLP
jgi:hypothetical protein